MNNIQDRVFTQQSKEIRKVSQNTGLIITKQVDIFKSVKEFIVVTNEDGSYIDSEYDAYFTNEYLILRGHAIVEKGLDFELVQTPKSISVAIAKDAYKNENQYFSYNFHTNLKHSNLVQGYNLSNGIYIGDEK